MSFCRIEKKNKGSIIVELIIAASIMIAFILIALNVAQKSIAVSHRAIRSTQAAFLLEEGAESVKIFRDNNTWEVFSGFFDSSYTYCLPSVVNDWNSALSSDLPCPLVGVFTRVINVTDVERDSITGDIVESGGIFDPGTKLIIVTVNWSENGNFISKNLKFYISDVF